MFILFLFSSVCVAEWSPLGKELLTRLIICSLCIVFDYVLILVISRFGFEHWIWILIASVPDLCIHFTLKQLTLIIAIADIRH